MVCERLDAVWAVHARARAESAHRSADRRCGAVRRWTRLHCICLSIFVCHSIATRRWQHSVQRVVDAQICSFFFRYARVGSPCLFVLLCLFFYCFVFVFLVFFFFFCPFSVSFFCCCPTSVCTYKRRRRFNACNNNRLCLITSYKFSFLDTQTLHHHSVECVKKILVFNE